MQSLPLLKCPVLLILSFPAIVFGFGFSFTPPTSCDNLTISWSGGNGPFSLLITPFHNVPQNISIPDSAIDLTSGDGSFSFQLTLPESRRFLLTMSDATGFESGGTSDVLTVGSSVTGANCNTVEPKPDFTFSLDDALQQCRPYTFSGYDGAKQPVRILGLIPLGQSFELDPPSGPTSFDWTADVPSETSIVIIMTDAAGRQGGSSDLMTVNESGDDSCINSSSPHSTAQPSSTSGVSSTQTGDVPATQTAQIHKSNQAGAIAGGTVGGIAFVALLLLFLCFRRRKASKYDGESLRGLRITRARSSLLPSNSRMRRAHPSFDLLPPTALHHSSHRNSPLHQAPSEDEYLPNPYILSSEASAADGHTTNRSSDAHLREPPPSVQYPRDTLTHARSHSRSHSRSDTDGQLSPFSALTGPYSQGHSRRPSVPYSNGSASARSPTKSSVSGTTQLNTPRFILHTDLDDVGGSEDGEEVVELPPQYTDRRGPDTKPSEVKDPHYASS